MENAAIPISVFLRKDYNHHPLDLSGEHLLDFCFDIKRCYPSPNQNQEITLLMNESVFDIPYAFQEGLLELIDEESGAVVVWPTTNPPARKERKFITLPKRALIPGRRGNGIASLSFEFLEGFKEVVQPGRRYRIWLRDLDLNVKWWSYNPTPRPGVPLLPSEVGKLVAKSTTNKLFHAVSSIRNPPQISITMSLSPATISYSDPPPTIRVEVTNLGPKTITVKSSGEQAYISTNNVNPGDALITSPSSPSLRQFLITSSTGTAILDIRPCASAGPYGLSKANFVTLEPGVPLVREGEFLVQEWIRDRLRNDGVGVFRLVLKRREAWWCEGSVEGLFGEREKLGWRELWRDACLPVVLEGGDEVGFAFVESVDCATEDLILR